MIPHDYEDYRATKTNGATLKSLLFVAITLASLVALLGWMGESDHKAKLEQVQQVTAAQCPQ